MVSEVQILRQIAEDVNDVKKRLIKVEISLGEIDSDLHEVKPEYIKKLKRIDIEGSLSKEEFEKRFGVRI